MDVLRTSAQNDDMIDSGTNSCCKVTLRSKHSNFYITVDAVFRKKPNHPNDFTL